MPYFDLITHVLSEQRPIDRLDLRGFSARRDPDVVLNETLLDQYSLANRAEWVRQGQEDNDFAKGAQWTLEQINELKRRRMAPTVVNCIYPAVEQGCADLTANDPRFSVSPIEGSDNKTASCFSDLVSYIWYHNTGRQHVRHAVRNGYIRGMGVLQVYVDPTADFGKGEVKFRSLPPEKVYFDPNCKRDFLLRDSAHMLVFENLTREQIQQEWPQYSDLLKIAIPSKNDRKIVSDRYGSEGQGSVLETSYDPYAESFEVIDRYTKIKSGRFRVYNPALDLEKIFTEPEFQEFLASPCFFQITSEDAEWITTERQVDQAMQVYRETGGIFHYGTDQQGQTKPIPGPENPQVDAKFGLQTVPRSTVELHPMTMQDALEAGELQMQKILIDRILRVFSIGGQLAYNGELPISDYPLIPIMFHYDDTPWPMSPVRIVRPIQEVINKTESLIMAHVTASTSLKLLLPRGSANKDDIESQWSKIGASVIQYDQEIGTPHAFGPIPLPNELFSRLAQSKQDIQDILGIYNLGQGSPQGAPDTYQGTMLIAELGQKRTKSKRECVEDALIQMGKIIIEYAQSVYTEPRVKRYLAPNSLWKGVEVNQPVYDDYTGDLKYTLNDVTVGRYDLQVVAGSMLPNNRWARLEYYRGLYKDGLVDNVEVLKQSDIPDLDGVLARMDRIRQLEQMVAELQDEVKNLNGDLQTARRESVHDRMRTAVEKFKANLQAEGSRVEHASVLYKERLMDQLSMQKQQMMVQAAAGGSGDTE